MSAAKRRVIEESYSEGERLVLSWGKHVAGLATQQKRIVVRQGRLRVWLAAKKRFANWNRYGSDGQNFLETPRKIAAILQKGCGLCLPKKRFEDSTGQFRVVANFIVEEAATWETLKDLCKSPSEVEPPQHL